MLCDCGDGAMNGSCAMMPANTQSFSYAYAEMNFMAALAIGILIANSCTRRRRIFNGLSQNGGWADFSKDVHASLFKKIPIK
jgi:hypothetical protein